MVIYRASGAHKLSAEFWLSHLQSDFFDLQRWVWHQPPQWGWHKHIFTEILIAVEGELVLKLPNKTLLIHPGDQVIIPAYTLHTYDLTHPPCELIIGFRI